MSTPDRVFSATVKVPAALLAHFTTAQIEAVLAQAIQEEMVARAVSGAWMSPPLRPRAPGEAVGAPGTFEAGPPPLRPRTPPTPPPATGLGGVEALS